MIGQTISHYRILEKLGGGGMGVVYKAQDLKLGRFVALKFLPHHLSADEDEKKRFIHEAKAASALDHPNICNIHEIDETEDGQMFIAMAYYEGETLKKKIDRGPLTWDEAINFTIQVAQGLDRAHEAGITHRDIKPANIMITTRGEVKIVDFGLAKLAGRTKLTKEGMTLGTVAYMSPEQAQGVEADRRTDIWALGIVLYEMLTGQLPFRGEYEAAMVYSILHENPQPITGLRSGIPLELERLVNKCLEKDPSARYQHADELIVDLKALAESLKSARLKSKPTVETSPKRKRTFLYIGLATVLVLLIAMTYFFTGRSDGKVIDSIAVLPLENFSGDANQEYFADGMTEALIADLAQISSLRVISRTSVMQYKGVRKPLTEIARELHVDAILEGTVFHDGQRVRITAQLIEAATDRHLWVKSYERDLRDILALHSEVARAVAREIKITLTADEEIRLATSRPVNPVAHEAYLKGQYHLQQFKMGMLEEDHFRPSVEYFQQAIELDPDWAKAHAALAQAYHFAASAGVSPSEYYPKSKAAALKALEIDETVSDAHGSLAFVLHYYDWDWVAAEREYRRALELNPNPAEMAWGVALFFLSAGHYDDAILWYKRAEERNPLFIPLKAQLGWAYTCAGQYDQAIKLLRNTLELEPNSPYVRINLADAYLRRSMYEEALAELQKVVTANPESSTYLANLGYAYAVAGRKGEALEVLNRLEKEISDRYFIALAELYVALGKKNEALVLLQKAYEKRSSGLLFIRCYTVFDSLRDNPAFQEILRGINFPEKDIQLETRQ